MKLSVLIFLLGALFLVQCERDRGTQQEMSGQIYENNQGSEDTGTDYRRHDEGRGDGESPGYGVGHVVEIADNRVDLIDNMHDLLSDIVDELEESPETNGDTETFKQAQSDQLELTQLIHKADAANDQTWEEIREDVQESYVRIAVDHNERIRPEGAHGGRGFRTIQIN